MVSACGTRLDMFVEAVNSTDKVETPQKEVVTSNKKFGLTLDEYRWSRWDEKDVITRCENFTTSAEVHLLDGVRYGSLDVEFCRDGDFLWIILKYSKIENEDSSTIDLGECNIVHSFSDSTVWIGFNEGHIMIHFGCPKN